MDINDIPNCETKCEINLNKLSQWQKCNQGETWNCTHLRVRSVQLGLAKQDGVEGVVSSQSEAQPGNDCSASREAA